MKFSIITPSFRGSKWLKLCIPSVADQEGVHCEHIVQDSESDDGTQEWLPKDPRVRAFIEKDKGMYDAANRGFKRATGDVLAYLNCDEQYLPGALASVERHFRDHPEIDAVCADSVVTDSAGQYVCSRYTLVPRQYQMWVRFPVLSCAFFVRRRVVHEMGAWFDTQWKNLGDYFWVLDMLKRGVKMSVLPRYTSVFADTGENMNLNAVGVRESQLKWKMAPAWVRLMEFPLAMQYRIRLAARGALTKAPFDYDLYTHSSPGKRVTMHAACPTARWKSRAAL